MTRSRRFISVERLERIASKAIMEGYGSLHVWDDNGYPRRLVVCDLTSGCEDARGVELHARYSAEHGKAVRPLTVSMKVRCRKCDNCKALRTRFWSGRALSEFGQAKRTLFGTLTVRFDEHLKADNRIRYALDRQGVNFDALPEGEKFAERAAELGRDVTKFIKRLRKGRRLKRRWLIRPKFRYLIVCERHDGKETSDEMRNRPHFHFLFHETSLTRCLVRPGEVMTAKTGKYEGKQLVREYSFLRKNWNLGFSSVLVAEDSRACLYVSKYINKSVQVRVRNSQNYGNIHAEQSASNKMKSSVPDGPMDPPGETDPRRGALALEGRTASEA